MQHEQDLLLHAEPGRVDRDQLVVDCLLDELTGLPPSAAREEWRLLLLAPGDQVKRIWPSDSRAD